MGNVLINDKYLKDIAAALRAKNDTMRTYKTSEMAAAIQAIPQEPPTGISADDMFEGTWDGGVIASRATTLGNAFQGMPITYVKAPNAEEVGYGAFLYCEDLTNFEGGIKTVSINNQAFEGCSNLESVGDTYYAAFGTQCFKNCPKLKRIRLYGEIGYRAFDSCSALEKIDVMGVMDELEFYYTFYQCPNLKTIILRTTDKVIDLTNVSMLPSGAYIYVPRDMYDAYYAAATTDRERTCLRRIEEYADICDWKEAD